MSMAELVVLDLLKEIRADVLFLKREVTELRDCFHEDVLRVRADVRAEVEESRRSGNSSLIDNDAVVKEFL